MASIIKFRRGTTEQHQSFTGLQGEITVDLTKKTAVVHDGTTLGGTPLVTEPVYNAFSSNVYTKSEVDDLFDQLESNIGYLDLNAYVTETELNSNLALYVTTANLLSAGSTAGLATNAERISGDNNLQTQIDSIVSANYATVTYVDLQDQALWNELGNIIAGNVAGYVTDAELSATLAGYATVSSLNNYVLKANLAAESTAVGMATQAQLNNDLNTLETELSADIATKANISDLSNYVTNTALTNTLIPYTRFVDTAPVVEEGQAGDKRGMMAFDNNFLYICIADWQSPGTASIWRRIAWYDTIIGS